MASKSHLYQNSCCKLNQPTTKFPIQSFHIRNRSKLPTAIDVIDKAVAELQDSLDSAKERFNYANGALLQASRLIYDSHPYLIRSVYSAKKDVYKEMYDKITDTNLDEGQTNDESKPVTTTTASTAHFIIGEDLTEDHVQAEIEVLTRAKQILLEEAEGKKEEQVKK